MKAVGEAEVREFDSILAAIEAARELRSKWIFVGPGVVARFISAILLATLLSWRRRSAIPFSHERGRRRSHVDGFGHVTEFEHASAFHSHLPEGVIF